MDDQSCQITIFFHLFFVMVPLRVLVHKSKFLYKNQLYGNVMLAIYKLSQSASFKYGNIHFRRWQIFMNFDPCPPPLAVFYYYPSVWPIFDHSQHHDQTIHTTVKHISLIQFKIPYIVTWKQLLLTSDLMEAARGQKHPCKTKKSTKELNY